MKVGQFCPEWKQIDPRDYSGVWVVGEIDEYTKDISEYSLQMLTPGRMVASKRASRLEVLLLGSNRRVLERAARTAIEHGADAVRLLVSSKLEPYIPEVYGRAIAKLAELRKPEVMFFAATMRGRELAPYVANTLRTGITADCTQFDVDGDGNLVMIRPPFAAILLAYIKTPHRRPQIATARPNVFPTPPRQPGRKGEVIYEDESVLEGIEPRTILLKRVRTKVEETPLEKAEYVVAGGRGVASPEGFRMLEELALLLGGVVAGSRKAVDMGLVPHERQVGQTGKSVKAKLYVAVGISGAAQHVIGIRECRVVVAVNKDPEAPIFRHADYGIVADWKDVIPLLIEKLRERLKKCKEAARAISPQ